MSGEIRWQARIDWDGQGIWGAAGVDASDDVLGLRWRWGRCGLPVPEFAPPAEVELTLRNHDHRYTPGNVNGPLGDNVGTGREVWLRAGYIHDDFATPGGASVDLHDRSVVNGSVKWQVIATEGNGFPVSDGTARGTTGVWPPADSVALVDTDDPLATLTARFRRGSNGLGGFVLRCVGKDDCLRLRFTNNASRLERVSGGNITTLAAGSPLDAGAWHELEVEQTGDSVRVYATKLDAAGTVRKPLLAAVGIADAPASGRHGLWRGFGNAIDRWGEFNVGRSLFVGRITAIEPDHAAGVCRVTAADGMERLESVLLYRKLDGGVMRSGQVAAAILGWAGIAPDGYALDNGRVLLTGGPRAVWDVSAGRALRRLQREEHGLIYADGLGRVRLEAASVRAGIRNHQTPASLARFSIADTAGGTGAYAGVLRRSEDTALEDAVTFRYRRSSDAGRQRVWSLNEALEIPANGEQRLLAAPDAWDVIDGIAALVAGTDYTATDDAAGDGADVSDNVTVSLVAEAESGVLGKGHVLRIRNTGAATAYLQRLELTANHCWRAQSSSAARVESTSSGSSTITGLQRGRLVRCRYADHYAAAQSAAEARLAERSSRRSHLELALPLATAGNRGAAVEGRLSDVMAVEADAQGIAGAWLLEGMEVRVAGGGDGEARWWLMGV
ncbi:MAG: hypothetical protein F4W95_06310 [Chloroflexi bacterium]|nr:hypothetical protein [Chloroflexota bacterium]MYD48082.1 hypothetical protein [Chloroflexota bacterium]